MESEQQRERKREATRDWLRRHPNYSRQYKRAQWEKLKRDPGLRAAYNARRRADARERARRQAAKRRADPELRTQFNAERLAYKNRPGVRARYNRQARERRAARPPKPARQLRSAEEKAATRRRRLQSAKGRADKRRRDRAAWGRRKHDEQFRQRKDRNKLRSRYGPDCPSEVIEMLVLACAARRKMARELQP